MHEQVRDATPADVPRVHELLAAALGDDQAPDRLLRGSLDRQSRGPSGPTASQPSAGHVPGAVSGEEGADIPHLLVGQLDGVVVGVALVSVDGAGPASCGLVRLVYVEPDAREVGVGGLLLEEAIRWARAQGCVHVDAVALPGDRGTKRLLEATGFKTRQLRMRLGGGPTAS